MTLGTVFKIHPLVLILDNQALGIVLNCVVQRYGGKVIGNVEEFVVNFSGAST